MYSHLIKEIRDSGDKKRHMRSFYENNRLFLDYPSFEKDLDEDWIVMFDELNDEFDLYDKCTHLSIETDSFYCLPERVSKFKSLVSLTISGCRMFYLTCESIPTTVKYLDFNEQSNLNPCFLKGFDRLVNIVELKFPCDSNFYGVDYEGDIIFNHPSLQRIIFCSGYYFDDEEIHEGEGFKCYTENIREGELMANLKHRIESFTRSDCDIIVNLKPE